MASSAERGTPKSTTSVAAEADAPRDVRAAGRRAQSDAGRTQRIVPLSLEARSLAARRFRTLGHPLRLQLLEVLAGGPRSVTDLARLVGEEHYLVSKHLTEMLRCDVVVRRQEGSFALYSLPNALTLKGVALVCRSVVEDRARLARLGEDASPDRLLLP